MNKKGVIVGSTKKPAFGIMLCLSCRVLSVTSKKSAWKKRQVRLEEIAQKVRLGGGCV